MFKGKRAELNLVKGVKLALCILLFYCQLNGVTTQDDYFRENPIIDNCKYIDRIRPVYRRRSVDKERRASSFNVKTPSTKEANFKCKNVLCESKWNRSAESSANVSKENPPVNELHIVKIIRLKNFPSSRSVKRAGKKNSSARMFLGEGIVKKKLYLPRKAIRLLNSRVYRGDKDKNHRTRLNSDTSKSISSNEMTEGGPELEGNTDFINSVFIIPADLQKESLCSLTSDEDQRQLSNWIDAETCKGVATPFNCTGQRCAFKEKGNKRSITLLLVSMICPQVRNKIKQCIPWLATTSPPPPISDLLLPYDSFRQRHRTKGKLQNIFAKLGWFS